MDGISARVNAGNAMRWDGRRPRHYETWFLTANHRTSGAGFWIRYGIRAPRDDGRAPHGVVGFASSVPDISSATVAIVQRYPSGQFHCDPEPFALTIGPCHLRSERITGMIEAGGVPVAWDLVCPVVTDPLVNLPEPLYGNVWTRTKLLTPHPFLSLGGKIQIRDHSFILNNDPGQQGHLWGRRYPGEWIWLHCSSFVENETDPLAAYVAGFAAQGRFSRSLRLSPSSYGHLVWKKQHIPLVPASRFEDRWRGKLQWRGLTNDREVVVEVELDWADMVVAELEDPSGQVVFCHHSDRADCTVRFRSPRQAPEVHRALGTAHVEIGSTTRDPRARRIQEYPLA